MFVRSRHFDLRRQWLVAAVSLAALGTGCSRHVRLVFPEAEKASRYVCREGESPCEPATSDIPSERNRSGTTQITLPKECGGRFQEIVVLDADSSEPTVDVTCAVGYDSDDASPVGQGPAQDSVRDAGIQPDPDGGIGTME